MSVKRKRTRKTEQAEATRAELLASARELFARKGYAQVSVEEIVRAARVTKGALYHYFGEKSDLFRAVVEQIEREIHDRLVEAAGRDHDPQKQLRAACGAYLDACVRDEVGRILVLDAPGVLSWRSWCTLERDHSLGFFADRVRSIQGDWPGVESTAQMLLGALGIAGRVIAQAADRNAVRHQVGDTIERLIAGITAKGKAATP